MDWLNPVQDTDKNQFLVNAVINIRIHKSEELIDVLVEYYVHVVSFWERCKKCVVQLHNFDFWYFVLEAFT